jgi:hypothetical protein
MPLRIPTALAACLPAVSFLFASQECSALLDQALQPGHVLFAVEGTVARVDNFFDAYGIEYAKGGQLNDSCGPVNKIYQEAVYYVVFVCNPDPAAFPVVRAVFDGVKPPGDSNSELLSITMTNTLVSRNPDCTTKRCTYEGATCTYYQCPVAPWCYHTGTTYMCKTTHKCP